MEETKIYIINIGDFTADGVTYPDRCLSASYGGQGVASEVIPWEGTENNPWDYKYEEGAFVLEPITLPEAVEEPTQLDRIEAQTMFTALMTDTLLEA